jgi:hypothetical protein
MSVQTGFVFFLLRVLRGPIAFFKRMIYEDREGARRWEGEAKAVLVVGWKWQPGTGDG